MVIVGDTSIGGSERRTVNLRASESVNPRQEDPKSSLVVLTKERGGLTGRALK